MESPSVDHETMHALPSKSVPLVVLNFNGETKSRVLTHLDEEEVVLEGTVHFCACTSQHRLNHEVRQILARAFPFYEGDFCYVFRSEDICRWFQVLVNLFDQLEVISAEEMLQHLRHIYVRLTSPLLPSTAFEGVGEENVCGIRCDRCFHLHHSTSSSQSGSRSSSSTSTERRRENLPFCPRRTKKASKR